MTESEKKAFGWAQDYDNFTLDTFASFIADVTPVKEAAAQMNNVMTQYANPLFYGVGDVDAGLDKLKKAADAAGLDVIMTELAKQGRRLSQGARLVSWRRQQRPSRRAPVAPSTSGRRLAWSSSHGRETGATARHARKAIPSRAIARCTAGRSSVSCASLVQPG